MTGNDRALAVTGLGLVSSVGHDAATACASIRAGVARSSPLALFEPLSAVSDDDAPIHAHRINGLTDGFNFLGLWVRLAELAIADLARALGPGAEDLRAWSRTAVICVLPVIDPRRFLLQDDDDPRELMSMFGDLLLEAWPAEVRSIVAVGHGAPGLAPALDHASTILAAGVASRVLIVAVDSLADVHSVEWLAGQDRLKTGARPDGLVPGEAGASLLLERIDGGNGHHHSVLSGWSFAHTNDGYLAKGPNANETVMADALGAVLDGRPAFAGDIYSDHNGETWKARAFGRASAQLAGRLSPEARWHFPASSVGDAGAAAGVLGVCLASRSMVRGYAASRRALVSCVSEYGYGAAVAVDGEL